MSVRYTDISDDALLQRIRLGDQQALEWVYKANRNTIHRYVLRNQGNRQDAQDLYQEVMVSFYENVVGGRLQNLQAKLSTYLFQLAQNQWRKQLRRRQAGVLAGEAETDIAAPAPPNTAYDDAFLQRMLERLDGRCRHILHLFYFDRLPMPTVAERVGLPDGEAARKRKYDCLDRLKRLAQRFTATDYDP